MENIAVQKLDYEAFREKLGKWGPSFRPFIEGREMWDIYQQLKADAVKETIVPASKDTFRAFSTTDPKDVKVIFYLMDPYPRKYKDGELQATGIAMDCSNSKTGKLQPSLEIWYDAIEKQANKNTELLSSKVKINRSPSLDYLHEQGVMLLNSDLTCKLNKTGSHEGLWKPFQKFFLEEVMTRKTGIIYVLCGKASHEMERYINPLGNYIFKLSHPAAASHTHTDWEDKGIFAIINRILFENNGPQAPIYWNKDDWDLYKEPPF